MSLSQFPTQEFIENTPISNTKITKKASSSKKPQCHSNKSDNNKNWSNKEDEALMSAWCNSSIDLIVGKNQNVLTRWNKVFDLYEQTRVENRNKNKLCIRSIDAMKSRYKRLNFLVNKWVGCYKQVLNRPPASGTNTTDDIEAAQILFRKANDGNDFVDFDVFNNVMSKHQKWSLQSNDFGVNKDVSGSTTKRSREDMECTPSSVNVSTPSSVNGEDEINTRSQGREAAKRNRNGKAIMSNSIFSEGDASSIDKLGNGMESQIEQRQRRIEADLKIEELRSEATKTKMEMKMLDTLLAKQHLTPRDEQIYEKLAKKFNLLD